MRLITIITAFLIGSSVLLFGYSHLPAFNLFTHSAAPVKSVQPPGSAGPGLAIPIGTLPPQVKESSGIEEAGKPGTYYTHGDAHNPAVLYQINEKGHLLASINLSPAENIDWEDLARDNQGNIFIGDTGNNSNKRRQLKIYKLNPQTPENLQVITYVYADRENGTADKAHYEFDCEAIFWHQNKLHLITKDRTDGEIAKLYELPDQPGTYQAQLKEHYQVNQPVTGADISPDGKTLLLLSKGKVHLFHPKANGDFFGGEMQTLNLGPVGQTEAAVFTSNKTIVLTNENGNLYRYNF